MANRVGRAPSCSGHIRVVATLRARPNWSGGPVVNRHAEELTTALYESRGLSITMASKLPEILANSGFVNIHVERLVIPLGNGRENLVKTGGTTS